MTKKLKPTHIRKTVFMKIETEEVIKDLANDDNRSFSSFVNLMLEDKVNESRK